jgi:hypothetical protein
MFCSASQISFVAVSSAGKWPLVLMILRKYDPAGELTRRFSYNLAGT